jgi:capsular polysaccharide biosynthesis protein
MTNAFLAAILGLVTTVLVLLIREFRDTTIRSVEELTRQYQYPVLASVPDLFERAGKPYYKSYNKGSYKE